MYEWNNNSNGYFNNFINGKNLKLKNSFNDEIFCII